ADAIARWNGSSWQPLGPPTNAQGIIALVNYNGELIALGEFPAVNAMRWNGSSWTPLSVPLGLPSAWAVYRGKLIAAAYTSFQSPWPLAASWNGSTSQPLGTANRCKYQ